MLIKTIETVPTRINNNNNIAYSVQINIGISCRMCFLCIGEGTKNQLRTSPKKADKSLQLCKFCPTEVSLFFYFL